MLVKDVSSFTIKGRCFETQSKLDLFPGKHDRVSFVFGRNGSGKSTISSALVGKASGTLPDGIAAFDLTDSEGKIIQDQAEVLNRTFVFNEDFVSKNIQVSDDGLNAIVMIGETGDLTQQIRDAKKDLEGKEHILESIKEQILKTNDFQDPSSPSYYRYQINMALSSPNGWSDRQKRIKGLKRAASVTDQVIDLIISLSLPSKPLKTLNEEYAKKVSHLESLSAEEGLPLIPNLPEWVEAFNEEALIDALGLQLVAPDLSDRDKKLLQIAESIGTSRLAESRAYFTEADRDFCPFCFRDISSEEVSDLVSAVGRVLNEAADEHAKLLDGLKLTPLNIDVAPFMCLGESLVRNCTALLTDVESSISSYNLAIEQKKSNLYCPVQIDPLGLKEKLRSLSESLARLTEARTQWSRELANKNTLMKDLMVLNEKIARVEIDSLVKGYNDKVLSKRNLIESEKIASLNFKEAEELLSDLEAQKASIKIALDEINRDLAFIFLDKERLVLSGENGSYALFSHGDRVIPKDVSAGERNAIGLCYFFTLIGAGKKPEDAYSDEILVVLDDPISSLDQENRIGILSLLRKKIEDIACGNCNTKVLCLTHDGYSMNAFDKMKIEIKRRSERKGGKYVIACPKVFELNMGSVSEWKLNNMRYTELVQSVYDYSLNPNNEGRRHIGNIARKMLEAFSIFEYGIGLSEFADSQDVLDDIQETALRNYYSQLLFHVVLHSESHTGDPVQVEGLIETIPEYTDATIDRIARDSILLMYSINPRHVLKHLKESDTSKETLDDWISQLIELVKGNVS